MFKTEHNLQTGEIIEIALTDQEATALEKEWAKEAKRIKEEETEAESKAQAKATAEGKLAALGLTTGDLRALGL